MGKLGGEASADIGHAIHVVYALLEDVAIAPQWQSGLEEMNILERDPEGRPALCETASDAKVRVIRTQVRFSYEPLRAVRWVQVKGDIKSLTGAWELQEIDEERTRVTYRLHGDPGRALGLLVRGPVEEAIRQRMVLVRPGEVAARLGRTPQ